MPGGRRFLWWEEHEIGILCSKMAMGHFVVSAQVCFRGKNRDLLYIYSLDIWLGFGSVLFRQYSVTWAVGSTVSLAVGKEPMLMLPGL